MLWIRNYLHDPDQEIKISDPDHGGGKTKIFQHCSRANLKKLFSKPMYMKSVLILKKCSKIYKISGYSGDFMLFQVCLPDPDPKLLFPDPAPQH